MRDLILDVRYGVRQLSRQRGSSIVAILTLALGIGVSTAIFSVVDATMLRPLPYPHPEQLVMVVPEVDEAGGNVSRATASMADLRTWQESSDVFTAVAGVGSAFRGRITDGPQAERVRVLYFTENYLSMHGVTPLKGRGFTREDTEVGSVLVAMLGYGYWRSRFGGQDTAIGQTIRLDDEIATIVGVLPAWFQANTPVVTPLRIPPDEFARRGTGRVQVYGRLRAGVTMGQADTLLTSRMGGRSDAHTNAFGRERAVVTSRLEASLTSYRTTVNILAGAVGLILLLAAVNVAGLLMARGAARQSELAVRASLGAGRGRLIRQLLTESAVLAVPASAIGVLLAWLSLDAIVANLPLRLPVDSPIELNLTVIALTIALLVPVTLLFGLAPAIRLSRVRVDAGLARGARQVGSPLSRRGGQLLIAAEIALAVVLVAGSGLMIRSFFRIGAVDLGFNAAGLVTMEVLPLERNPVVHREYYSALLDKVRSIPGVAAAGLVDNFALGGGTMFSSVYVNGKNGDTTMFEVLPGYFETIGAALKEGRLMTDADYASRFRGAVINASAARTLFPGGPATGRQFVREGQRQVVWTVLGVIADLRHGGPLEAQSVGRPQFFFPLQPTQFSVDGPMTVVVRPSGKTPALAERLRAAAESVGPRVLVERIRGSDDWFGERVITPRRRMVLLGLLGALGLTLALVGVFGMTAYAVTRRTAEIGVRIAFGARQDQVVATILRDAAIPIVLGTAIGVAGAAAASRVIESFLFETAPRDPATLAVVALLLTMSGCLAALVPALRAARVDPATSLRSD